MNQFWKRFRGIKLFVPLMIFLVSCEQNNAYKNFLSNPILFTNAVHELNEVVMGYNFPPIVASRNYTYASIAAYEAIAAGYPNDYQSLAGQLTDLKSMPKPVGEKINYELAALLAFMKVGEAVTFPRAVCSCKKTAL